MGIAQPEWGGWLTESPAGRFEGLDDDPATRRLVAAALARIDGALQSRDFSLMKKASITEAKNNLSALIDSLKDGSPVLIADRGRPVARLEPALTSDDGADEGRLNRLVRDGLVRPGRAASPVSILSSRPPRASAGASALDALIADRREGREVLGRFGAGSPAGAGSGDGFGAGRPRPEYAGLMGLTDRMRLRVHALRASDALQLGAAFVAAERRPPFLELVTFDDRLADVARKEGFVLIDPTAI